jgi:cytidyltransferase-like protein
MDMLHEGHINLLTHMRSRAKRVIVILHDDYSTWQNKKRFPVQSIHHRRMNLTLTKLADIIITCEKADPSDAFEKILTDIGKKSAIYIRGEDWPMFPGRPVIERHKIPIELIPYTQGVSSTMIRNTLQHGDQ